jgi:hypothetical protein
MITGSHSKEEASWSQTSCAFKYVITAKYWKQGKFDWTLKVLNFWNCKTTRVVYQSQI